MTPSSKLIRQDSLEKLTIQSLFMNVKLNQWHISSLLDTFYLNRITSDHLETWKLDYTNDILHTEKNILNLNKLSSYLYWTLNPFQLKKRAVFLYTKI